MDCKNFKVNSENVAYSDTHITSKYKYETTSSEISDNGEVTVTPHTQEYEFQTDRRVPRLGCLIVGLGGNNGTTLVAGSIANKEGICWRTKSGVQTPNYYGSLTQASTLDMGRNKDGESVHIPFSKILPMVDPNEIVYHGWDINNMNLAEAMERSEVLDYDLQRQLVPFMKDITPLPSIYIEDFIASNQKERANNTISGTKQEMMEHIRNDIRTFKAKNNLDQVVVLWSANTERFCDVVTDLNDTSKNLLASIERNEEEISASTLFAVASILEGCPYINGSPQNTFVPGCIELANERNVMIGGDDFKTGQTKIKSVMVDFLISAGIKPVSIVSYNHLGNNDGKNLSEAKQFRSKEISKSNVVDDMVASNDLLYKAQEHPDHCIVIKYIPYVGDSKRAMDEYTSQIFMGGHNTIVMHNTCEDSLLAAPLMLDLVVLLELMQRIKYKTKEMDSFEPFHPVASLLSFLLKAPLVPNKTPVVNALFKQRLCIENIFRACVGLKPQNNMLLEHKATQYSAAH